MTEIETGANADHRCSFSRSTSASKRPSSQRRSNSLNTYVSGVQSELLMCCFSGWPQCLIAPVPCTQPISQITRKTTIDSAVVYRGGRARYHRADCSAGRSFGCACWSTPRPIGIARERCSFRTGPAIERSSRGVAKCIARRGAQIPAREATVLQNETGSIRQGRQRAGCGSSS